MDKVHSKSYQHTIIDFFSHFECYLWITLQNYFSNSKTPYISRENLVVDNPINILIIKIHITPKNYNTHSMTRFFENSS